MKHNNNLTDKFDLRIGQGIPDGRPLIDHQLSLLFGIE